jgi:hypothetical protein
MHKPRRKPWQPDPNQMASGKPGAVQAALTGWSGVAMLMNEGGAMLWSVRKDLPRPRGCYGPVVRGFQMKGHDLFAQILPIRCLR